LDIRGLFFESFVDLMAGHLPFFANGFFDIFLEDFFTTDFGAGATTKEDLSGGALLGNSPKFDFFTAFFGADFKI
jgi:hypothetical protein